MCGVVYNYILSNHTVDYKLSLNLYSIYINDI
jgi:hypothetical protein